MKGVLSVVQTSSFRLILLAIALAVAVLVSPLRTFAGLDGASADSGKIGGDLKKARSEATGTRVLFVGNSYTGSNDLTGMVKKFADNDPDAPELIVVRYSAEGGRLSNAGRDSELINLLAEVKWDVLVLQEQSQLASFSPVQRRVEMDPYAQQLASSAPANTRTVLFNTWARRNGDPTNVPGDTYAAMQARVNAGYAEVALATGATVAPVGPAWAAAMSGIGADALWQDDGSHPRKSGSYLAAAVLYGSVTGGDPFNSDYNGGLKKDQAATLKSVASATLDRYR